MWSHSPGWKLSRTFRSLVETHQVSQRFLLQRNVLITVLIIVAIRLVVAIVVVIIVSLTLVVVVIAVL